MEKSSPVPVLTGEVIFESVRGHVNRKALQQRAAAAIAVRLRELRGVPDWASYLVIFSPGQDADEVRCQVDVDTSGSQAGFAIGFGHHPQRALHDALERMQWHEKNQGLRLSG